MEEIINRLLKAKDDRKVELYRTFLKHADELRIEREMILKLIDPPSSSSSSKMEDILVDNMSRKRKSPETALNPVKLSPESKRSSREFEQYLVNYGFPSDANKLKKEQLIELLEKRGITTFSMKNLKAQMIDALKTSFESPLVHFSQPSLPPYKIETPPKPSQTQLEVANDHFNAPKSSARKGSLMSEFRTLVNGGLTQSSNDEEWVKKEFNNRQSRHRESQVRKSFVETDSTEVASPEVPVAEHKLEPEPALHETMKAESKDSPQEIKGSLPTTMEVLNSTSSSQISESSAGSDVPSVSKLRKEIEEKKQPEKKAVIVSPSD
jgi:hypothetical protein